MRLMERQGSPGQARKHACHRVASIIRGSVANGVGFAKEVGNRISTLQGRRRNIAKRILIVFVAVFTAFLAINLVGITEVN